MNSEKPNVKYGILCPSTNLFYQIPDQATYKALLEQLQKNAEKIQKSSTQISMVSDSQNYEEEVYAKMMDQQVSNIFQDPMFTKNIKDIDYVEYDF